MSQGLYGPLYGPLFGPLFGYSPTEESSGVIETISLSVEFNGDNESTNLTDFINVDQALKFDLTYADESPITPVFRLCKNGTTTQYTIESDSVTIPVDVLTKGYWKAYVYCTTTKTASQLFTFQARELC